MNGPPIPFDAPVQLEYVRAIADYLSSSGVSVEGWLASCDVPTLELVRPGGTVPFAVFRRLMKAAMALACEPASALFVGQRIGAFAHGTVGAAVVYSSSVRQALDVIARYAGVRTRVMTIRRRSEGDLERLVFAELAPLGDMQRPALELAVVSLKSLLDEVTLGTCGVFEVSFEFGDPGYARIARDVLGCAVRYDREWTGFTMPASSLDRTLRRTDRRSFERAAELCQRELRSIAEQTSWAARVRRLLLEHHDRSGVPTLQIVARQLHLTPRTLHRRLVDEGSSYRAQLDAVRHMLALSYLGPGRLSVQEVAYRLGYSDSSNFRRAFKRWQGQAPGEVRGG